MDIHIDTHTQICVLSLKKNQLVHGKHNNEKQISRHCN